MSYRKNHMRVDCTIIIYDWHNLYEIYILEISKYWSLTLENTRVEDIDTRDGITVTVIQKWKYVAAAETRYDDSNKVGLMSDSIDNPIYFFISLCFVIASMNFIQIK